MNDVKTSSGTEKLSKGEKLAYGAGQMNDLFMNNFVAQVINPVYNIALRVPLDLIGYALAIPRLWDAISDPLVGSLSDNFRSRWGRRKPFMVVGVLISAVSLTAMWLVPATWGVWAMFLYLIALSIIFYTGNTLFLVPYNALGLALSDDYNERTNLFAYKSLIDTVGGFMVPWAYFFVTQDWFDSTVQGTQVLSMIVGVGFLIFCAIPVCLCKERHEARIAHQEKIPLFTGIRESMSNMPFVLLASAVMLMFFGMFMTGSIGMYLNIYYVYEGNEKSASAILGWIGTMWKISSLLCLPLIVYSSRKIGKKQTFAIAMLLAAFSAISNWWCLNPEHPYRQLIPPLLTGPAISCVLLMMNSMLADICDMDELRNGARHEAMFTAINGWMTKVGITGATAISGILITLTGFRVELATEQTTQTIIWMRLLNSGGPAIGMFLGALLIWFYPISKAKADEIKNQLMLRHQKEESEYRNGRKQEV